MRSVVFRSCVLINLEYRLLANEGAIDAADYVWEARHRIKFPFRWLLRSLFVKSITRPVTTSSTQPTESYVLMSSMIHRNSQ